MVVLIKKLLIVVLLFFIVYKPAYAIDVSAESAILIEAESGRVIFGKNENEKMKIASITKIMTAHLALTHGKLSDKVKISNEASSTEGSSIYLKAGDTITLEDLLYGLLLRSGNDAAVAIAEHISGSVEKFAKLMNKEAAHINMTQTHFSNPHGLDTDDEHYSTALDMALLTQYAIQNKKFREIFSSKTYTSSMENAYPWSNKHRLVTGLYPHANGGKTGYTKKAGRTLVTTAKKENLTFIAVTINGPDDWNDHISLFENGFNHYHLYEIVSRGPLPHIPGLPSNIQYISEEEIKYPLTDEERQKIVHEIVPGTDPRLKVYIQDEMISNHALKKVTYEPPSFYENLIRKMKELFEW
ncbi:D-alanyl-D-alanine carboxypeptidase family protein [Jeotgalibacillus salarius]|uniref:D-alanyl-D-alanine carboxypeptidase n=1 Tax=Jeotgalibacillus salarius TaxID=546023 RepID=A0A4Y8LKM3_9BACL|nr:D-alanyl-D-alanine carboxypeptidase family protein [Jeotgalibacillus salarius]TFE03125.1 D-alanyl-D-alanine carboxypeptidase [Jeotgalibacillus salarius]